jgi:hypothetical protein
MDSCTHLNVLIIALKFRLEKVEPKAANQTWSELHRIRKVVGADCQTGLIMYMRTRLIECYITLPKKANRIINGTRPPYSPRIGGWFERKFAPKTKTEEKETINFGQFPCIKMEMEI